MCSDEAADGRVLGIKGRFGLLRQLHHFSSKSEMRNSESTGCNVFTSGGGTQRAPHGNVDRIADEVRGGIAAANVHASFVFAPCRKVLAID